MSWIIAIIAVLYALAIARRLVEAEQELRTERRLRWQAEYREERSNAQRRRLSEINYQIAKTRPMYFGEMPTMDMAYIVDGRWLEYHHDN